MSAERARFSVSSCRSVMMGIDGDSVTAGGRLFHTRAAATGNARSPIVECRILGTKVPSWTPTDTPPLIQVGYAMKLSREIRWSEAVLPTKSQDRHTVRDSLQCAQPVKVAHQRSDVVVLPS